MLLCVVCGVDEAVGGHRDRDVRVKLRVQDALLEQMEAKDGEIEVIDTSWQYIGNGRASVIDSCKDRVIGGSDATSAHAPISHVLLISASSFLPPYRCMLTGTQVEGKHSEGQHSQSICEPPNTRTSRS